MRTVLNLCLLAIGLMVLAGCQGDSVSAAPEPTSEVVGLAGTTWVLSALDGDLPLPDSTVTLQFRADGSVSGSDGCNLFNTTFAQDGNILTIAQPAASTLVACQADVMSQATAFMDALARTSTFTATDRQLILQDDGQILATFVAISLELAGTSWEVTAFNNGREAVVSPIVGSEITADFGGDATVSGTSGCNNYFAGFSANGGTIAVDMPGSTFRFCDEPPGVMEQEAEFLAALTSATTYSIDGNMLQMRTADDQLALVMTRRLIVDLPAPPPAPTTPWGRATAPGGLNVRSGPGANFPVIGVARYGDEGEIIGRSADGRWWAVSVPSTPGGIGWVSADFVLAMNVANVPVLEAPAPPVVLPTAVVPPATPTPLPPATATPVAQISFSADQTTIDQGQCTTLRWSAQNVESIWINPQNDLFDRTPHPSQGSQQVCPVVTTTYEMRTQQRDGSFVVNEVTVNVNATQEAQISFWADSTTIDQGRCTRLHWSVENVQSVWVYPQGERFDRFPRVGNDSESVCPERTTTYEMRVLLRDNSTVFRTVTINVNVVATPVPPTATPAPVVDPLVETRWDVIQFNTGRESVTSLLGDTTANVNFGSGGQVSGNASCNNFNTSYQVNGRNITIGQPSTASMLCPDPEGVMEQEAELLAALQSAATFSISGNVLEMRNGSDQIAVILQRAP